MLQVLKRYKVLKVLSKNTLNAFKPLEHFELLMIESSAS